MPVPRGWLDHNALQIIKGLGATPTDNFTAEIQSIVINLLSGLYTLEADGWSPSIPATKSGGVWADSPITDGRRLLVGALANVTEKITINIADSSYLATIKALSSLNQMVDDCRNFWQSQAQIDPVYLAWWASCGIGMQYALISNIELAPTYVDANKPTIRVDMTIEREPLWRPIPPGANPKLWTFYFNSQQIGTNKTLADATLQTGTDHLIVQTIFNKTEWSPTALGLQNTYLSQNFIDIPASLVPGDAPALLEIRASEVGLANIVSMYMGLSTKKQAAVNHLGLTKANSYILAAGDGEAINGAAKAAVLVSNGEHSNGSAVNYYNVNKTLLAADTAYTAYVYWGDQVTSTILLLDRNFYRGQFAVFLRAKSTVDDTTVKAKVIIREVDGALIGNEVSFTDVPVPGAGAATFAPIYLGTVTLPLANRVDVSLKGYGIAVRESNTSLYIEVDLKNSAGANRTVTILDVVLLPMDEFLLQITTSESTNGFYVDNTGYLEHGQPDLLGISVATGTSSEIGVASEIRGSQPYLVPNVDQRLHFFTTNLTENSQPNSSLTLLLNIIPRWFGIRDV